MVSNTSNVMEYNLVFGCCFDMTTYIIIAQGKCIHDLVLTNFVADNIIVSLKDKDHLIDW